ncbi:MAG: hypothetical protein ACR2KV_12280 [Solirubrobacteraceae bacterium]
MSRPSHHPPHPSPASLLAPACHPCSPTLTAKGHHHTGLTVVTGLVSKVLAILGLGGLGLGFLGL